MTDPRPADVVAPPAAGARAAVVLLLGQLVRFFLGSCLGLVVDLSVFSLVTAAGGPPWLANTVSSGCALLAVYLAVTRYVFRAHPSRATLVRFACGYTASILAFSVLIDVLVGGTGWAPLLVKVGVLPVSFLVNFLISRWVFRSDPGPSTGPTTGPTATAAGA